MHMNPHWQQCHPAATNKKGRTCWLVFHFWRCLLLLLPLVILCLVSRGVVTDLQQQQQGAAAAAAAGSSSGHQAVKSASMGMRIASG
jgi:hypothetical protein